MGSGHWRESGWIDAVDYNPMKTYVREIGREPCYDDSFVTIRVKRWLLPDIVVRVNKER